MADTQAKITSIQDLLKIATLTSWHTQKSGCWNEKDGKISFSHSGRIYITPYQDEIPNILEKAGFSKNPKFLVPNK